MLISHTVQCPYCGEDFHTDIDCSGGDAEYIEDCYVCCRPITFIIEVDDEGDLVNVIARRDDE